MLSAARGLALALVAVPAGWLWDRIGRKPLVVVAGLSSAVGTGILLVARDVPMLYGPAPSPGWEWGSSWPPTGL